MVRVFSLKHSSTSMGNISIYSVGTESVYQIGQSSKTECFASALREENHGLILDFQERKSVQQNTSSASINSSRSCSSSTSHKNIYIYIYFLPPPYILKDIKHSSKNMLQSSSRGRHIIIMLKALLMKDTNL